MKNSNSILQSVKNISFLVITDSYNYTWSDISIPWSYRNIRFCNRFILDLCIQKTKKQSKKGNNRRISKRKIE